jgi:hypothetical protein
MTTSNSNKSKKGKYLLEEEIEVDVSSSITSKKKQTKILKSFSKKIKNELKNTHTGLEKKVIRLIEESEEDLDQNNVEINIVEKENVTENNKYLHIEDNILETKVEECEFDECEYMSTISSIIEQDTPTNYKERVSIAYPDEKDNTDIKNKPDNQLIELHLETFNVSYKIRLRANTIHINQIDVAKAVANTFLNRKKVVQLIISRTQTGKTGCLIATIYEFINNNKIPLDNIFIITGLSSKDWKNQTIDRVPDCLEKQVFHLSDLHTKFKDAVDGKQNVLVLIDEVQCACLKEQTINKVIDYLGWSLDTMFENDIKMVQFSATPDGILFGLKKWPEENRHIHIMKEGQGYYGSKQMLENNKLKQAKDLSGRDKYGNWRINNETEETVEKEIEENILEMFKDLTNFNIPKYALIRANGTNIEYVKENICNTAKKHGYLNKIDTKHIYEYTEDGNIQKDELNSTLKRIPKMHSIILIKEKLKCAYTIDKQNVGLVYERIPRGRVNDSFIIQGLLGRITGYSKHDIICYTNLDSVNKYEELFKENFSTKALSNVLWNSNSSNAKKKSTEGKSTYISDRFRAKDDHFKPALPIMCEFVDEEAHEEFIELFKEKTQISKEIYKVVREKLIELIEQDAILVTTNEKGELYYNDKDENSEVELELTKQNILNLLKQRPILKSVRRYTISDANPGSRRFKSFKNVHNNTNNPKPVGQSGTDLEFNIDMCIDDYNYDDCFNSKLIAWITYKK